MLFNQKSQVHRDAGFQAWTGNRHTDIATYRLNRPSGPIQWKFSPRLNLLLGTFRQIAYFFIFMPNQTAFEWDGDISHSQSQWVETIVPMPSLPPYIPQPSHYLDPTYISAEPITVSSVWASVRAHIKYTIYCQSYSIMFSPAQIWLPKNFGVLVLKANNRIGFGMNQSDLLCNIWNWTSGTFLGLSSSNSWTGDPLPL